MNNEKDRIICSLGKEYNESRLVGQLMEAYRIRQCYTCYRNYNHCNYYNDAIDTVSADVHKGKKELPDPCPNYENKFTEKKGKKNEKAAILSIIECILLAIFLLSAIAIIILLLQLFIIKIDNASYVALFAALETFSIGGLIAIEFSSYSPLNQELKP